MYDLIKSRRSIRKFKDTPITAEQLAKYIDAGRVAPSGMNLQPIKYVAVASKEMCDKLFPLLKWAGYLAPNYNPKEGERPTAYIAVCADKSIREVGYDKDIGAAIENIILSALSDGVGACWIMSVERQKASELLGLPDNLILSDVIALGYPAESPKEVRIEDGIKYYLDDTDTLCVPKRGIDEVLFKTI